MKYWLKFYKFALSKKEAVQDADCSEKCFLCDKQRRLSDGLKMWVKASPVAKLKDAVKLLVY
jgi:hypothetical protein